MSRLPTPGSDAGAWGDILNDYLSRVHNTDGTLKDGSVGSSQLQANAVTNSAIAPGAVNSASIASGSVTAASLAPNAVNNTALADNSVTANSLKIYGGTADQVLTLDPTSIGGFKWATPYSFTQVNADWNETSGAGQILNKPTIPAAQVSSDWNANSGVAEILNKPTLAAVAISGSYADLTNKPTIPTVTVTSVAGRTGDITLAESDIANLTTNLTAKAPLASPTFTGTVTVPAPTNTTDAATKAYVDSTVSSGAPDATAVTKGKLQLAGDLAGTGSTASSPVITNGAITTVKLADDVVTNSKIASGAVNTNSLAGGSVTTNEIANGTIINTDISVTANIAQSKIADLTTDLAAKMTGNTAIVGATKTKVTYDTKGLVTAGADATTADIADSTDRRYVTDAQKTAISNISGTNTGDQDLSLYATKADLAAINSNALAYAIAMG